MIGGDVVSLAAFAGVIGALGYIAKQEFEAQNQEIHPATLIFPENQRGDKAFNIPANGKMYSIDGGMTFIIDQRIAFYNPKTQEANFFFKLNEKRPIEVEFPVDKASVYLMAVDPKLANIPAEELFNRYGQGENDSYLLEGEVFSTTAHERIIRFKNVQQGKVYTPFYKSEFFQQTTSSSKDLIWETIFLTFGNPVVPDIFSTPKPNRA